MKILRPACGVRRTERFSARKLCAILSDVLRLDKTAIVQLVDKTIIHKTLHFGGI
jgi:hypothetical protein